MESYLSFLLKYHLLLLVVVELSFKDLLRFRHLPGTAYSAVNTEIVRRIFLCLDPFIPSKSAPAFFACLDQCSGIITGSIVRQILLLNVKSLQTFTTLTIVIRHRAPSPMQEFLKQRGYTARELTRKDAESGLVDLREGRGVVESVELYERIDNSGQRFSIVLLVSKHEPVSVLMACDNTADMIAISRDTVVAYYPRLTFADEGLLVNDCVEVDSSPISITTDDGSTLFSDNSHWKKPCGKYCPSLWRHSYDDDGTLKVSWNCPTVVRGGAASNEAEVGVDADTGSIGGSTRDEDVGSVGASIRDEAEQQETEGSVGSDAEDDAASIESERAEDVHGSDPELEYGGGDFGNWGSGTGWDVADAWRTPVEGNWEGRWGWCGSYFLSCDFPSDDFTYSEIFRWRVTNRCKNNKCPNSHLHDVLSKYGILF